MNKTIKSWAQPLAGGYCVWNLVSGLQGRNFKCLCPSSAGKGIP